MASPLPLTLVVGMIVSTPGPQEFQRLSEDAVAWARVESKAQTGDPVAQFTVGSNLYYASDQMARGLEWIRRAAEQSHAGAELHLGLCHDFGLGVAQNNAEALRWYRRAADHGEPAAARAVGDFYRRGRGVATDLAEAAKWYERAAAGGDLRGQYQFGEMLLEGNGVARNYALAYVWLTRAARQTPLLDNRKAIVELANIADARMSDADRVEAARHLDAAANVTP